MKNNEKPDVGHLLQGAGLRSTKQRLALGALLFDGMHKHVTAEQMFDAARKNRVRVSLATVYNTLHQFTEAGLLREVVIDSNRVYFDTNVDEHHHFFNTTEGHLMDVPSASVHVDKLPKLPAGMKLDSVEVVIRVSSRNT